MEMLHGGGWLFDKPCDIICSFAISKFEVCGCAPGHQRLRRLEGRFVLFHTHRIPGHRGDVQGCIPAVFHAQVCPAGVPTTVDNLP
jgi:hypothetical protein